MKAVQQGGPSKLVHRCIVAYGLGFFCLVLPFFPARGEEEKCLEDYAQIYVNQYFAPPDGLMLSETARKKSQALAYYARGRSLESQGRSHEAIKAYRQVLDNQPDQFFLARKTAYLLARTGQQEEALGLLEGSLSSNPGEPYAHISLSEFLATYQANDPEGRQRAFDVIENALTLFPDEPAVYEHLVKLYLSSDRREDARKIVSEAALRENKSSSYWLRLGSLAGQVWGVREGGSVTDAEVVNVIFAKALEFAGDDDSVVEHVGDYYHATSQFDPAITTYERIIASQPDRLDLREKLARAYGGKGDVEMVLETLKEIVVIDPQSAEVHKQIAGVLLRTNRLKEAIPHLMTALSITKGSATEYGALGQMIIDSKEFEIAVEFLEDAAELFPDLPDFPVLLAFSLYNLERWEEAVKHFETTLKLAKETQPQLLNERFYFLYAASHERLGNFKEAEKLFRKTMELIAKNDANGENTGFTATVYNYLGYMWLENDMNIDEAGELIKTAADLDPGSGAIADSLGWFHFKKGNFEAARDELLRAEQMIEKQDPVILDHIAQAFYQLGEKEKAIEYMERAVEMEPENAEYSTRLKEFRNGTAKLIKPAAPDAPPAQIEPVAKPAAGE